MMSVVLQCSCGTRFRVSAEALGGKAQCPACGRVLDAPTPAECAESTSVPARTSTALTVEPGPERVNNPGRIGTATDAGSLDRLGDDIPEPAQPAYRLASPGHTGWAGFLGGPLGGFLLMGRNYAKCGRHVACWVMVATGALVTAAAVGIGVALPETNYAANLYIAVPFWLGTYYTARHLQGRTFKAHREQGGQQASGWTVLGFVLLG